MREYIESIIQLTVSKIGGFLTGIIVVSIISCFSFAIRLIFYLERHLPYFKSGLRIDSLLDFLGFPLLIIFSYLILISGVIIDSIESPDSSIKILRNFKERKNNSGVKKLNFIVNERLSGKFIIIFIIGLTSFLIGHGLHAGTNFLNFGARDIELDLLYPDFYRQIWLLDEVIGHWFLFSGLLILIFLLGSLNLYLPSKNTISSQLWLISMFSAIISGPVWVVIAAEGEYAWWGIISAILMVIYFLREINKDKYHTTIRGLFGKYLIPCFLILFFISSLLGFSIYYVIFGKFIQPSELLKG